MERTDHENSSREEFFTSEDIVVQQLERAGRAAIPPLDLDGVGTGSVPGVDGIDGIDGLSRTNGARGATATVVKGNGVARKAPPAGAGGRTDGKAGKASYTGADIQILEGIQAIRHRPGMYIGSTSTSGLCHLIYEAVDNAVDEANAGYGQRVWVSIEQSGWVTVRDEARGIPFDLKLYQRKQWPAATLIMTVPHSGGKFEEGVYKTAGGLHGVGATVINALSEQLQLTIRRDGRQFQQSFRAGKAGQYTITPLAGKEAQHTGTELRWLYDHSIFDDDAHYAPELIEGRLQAAAYLNRGLTIEFAYWDDEAGEVVTKTYASKEGVSDYARALTPSEATPLFNKPIALSKSRDGVSVEVALLPNTGYRTTLHSFANGVRTRDGGVHETGFKAALTRVLNDQALRSGVIRDREKQSFKSEVVQQGLVAIVSAKLANPQFQGQTKDRLNNAPVEGIVRSIVDEGLKEWFEANPDRGKEWLRKVNDMQKARNEALLVEELARSGQKKGGELIDSTVSKKFIPCTTKDPERGEIFLVEGDSAGGTTSQGRFSEFQAVLKLRGKPLNVAKADLKRIVENEEIRTIIAVLGCGTRASYDHSRLKFKRIIFLTDADVDGLHIQCLLLTLFYQEFPDLIERGHIFVGCPPLYSVNYKGKTIWLADDEARKRWQAQNKGAEGLEFKRYKGLGEMNARQLRETTLDPAKRLLKQVAMEDAAVAARLVSALMEEGNAELRRDFLARHAREVEEVDV